VAIRPEEAAQALRDAEAAAERSTTAAGYQQASAHLILWGVVWLVANLLGYLRLGVDAYAWPLLTLGGVAGSFVIGLRARRGAPGARGHRGLMALLIALAIATFAVGLSVISPPQSFRQSEALICLAVGSSYIVLGAATGLRIAAVGLAIVGATLAGWLYARELFQLWMALAGGGGLILGGFWLRKA